jgi:beta-carotene hydroxylase
MARVAAGSSRAGSYLSLDPVRRARPWRINDYPMPQLMKPIESYAATAEPAPRLSDLGLDLLRIGALRRAVTLAIPFLCVAFYIWFAAEGWWAAAVLAVVCFSFCTYGSISHDLVHRTLGLSRGRNELLLAAIELLAIRSGHAYRLVHLHHHRRFPHEDDIEGAASKMTAIGSLVDGMTLQFRIYRWALARSTVERRWIVAEGIGCACLVIVSAALIPITLIPIIYIALVVMGSWIIPFITSYLPHDPTAGDSLRQTRLFRGRILSIVALEHLYHLEHHLYPSVPHHNWPRLARRLDPYFERRGITPIKIWF